VHVHTEDGVLYVMGRLNNAEIADLNQVLAQVGNVTKIVTLIDNVETLSNSTSQNFATTASSSALVQTPVAIDPDTVEPTYAQ